MPAAHEFAGEGEALEVRLGGEKLAEDQDAHGFRQTVRFT